jgi:predicted DNA-binding protein (MmcQ/YjbR family)
MTNEDALARVRAICLSLPEATEQETWGGPTFRVRAKIFAMPRRDDGRLSVWCKAPAGAQALLIAADPARFFSPPYVGPKGWIGVRLDRDVDWDELTDLITDSYRMTAPKRLAATLATGERAVR